MLGRVAPVNLGGESGPQSHTLRNEDKPVVCSCQPVERFNHVLSYRSDYRTVTVAALTAYFDDSGTHDDSSTVVVAGFVSPPNQWRRFTREWAKAGTEYGFSEFHFAEFLANNKESDFADTKKWNDKYKASVLRRLSSIAAQHSVRAFSASVSRADYDELVKGVFRHDVGGHFTFVVRAVLGFIEQWRADQGIKEPIEYIFSTMTGQPKREIDGVFDGALKSDDPLHKFGVVPGCHSFRDMRQILPLQAADLLAGCVYQRDKVRLRGIVLPQYVADTFNFFLTRGNKYFTSRFQTRQGFEQFIAKDPHVIVPEDRRPKPTPKGTRPNPPSKHKAK